MKETKTEVVDLKAAAESVDAVKEYAAEKFGFSEWFVEPVAVSKEGPARWCAFDVMGVSYVADRAALRIEGI